MAAAECVSETLADEARSSRLQWLRQRREILEGKLAQKNNELKTLCLEEAEITGIVPPEIPLEPGESPPIIRKKSSSNQNYNQSLLNKLKKTGSPEESELELERQVQINIADTALAVLNDPSESKANKRKHRSIYQQSQKRLQELNVQLNFIRQSHGSISRNSQSVSNLHGSQSLQTTAKHRTKKPRPPLDTTGKDLSPKVESRNLLQEGGISLSPLAPEHNFNAGFSSYEFQDLVNHGFSQTGSNKPNQNRATYHAPSPSDMRRGTLPSNTKYLEHDLNSNNNIYVAPDNFRTRAYSQGGNSSSSISPHLYPERPQRLIMPNTYTEEERQQQMMIRQMKLKKHQQQLQLQQQESEDSQILQSPEYPDSRFSTIDSHRKSSYHESDFNLSQFDRSIHDFPAHYSHAKPAQPPPILRPRDSGDTAVKSSELKSKSAVDTYVPPGYWMRLDDEIVWCTDDQLSADRFGSLDRRKQNLLHHSPNVETQSRYHTVALTGKNPIIPHHRPYPVQPRVQSPDVVKPLTSTSRMLMRTQSLGSVENYQNPASSHDNLSQDGSSHETSSLHSSKSKDKEWYETRIDSGPPPPPPPPPGHRIRRASQHNPLLPPPPTKERGLPVRSNSIPANRRLRETQQIPREDRPRALLPTERFNEGREIPAESKLLPGSQENGNETVIPLNSPTNHTFVQPGKYQPYREVTKPFEMSDFYKYSTKFRKRVETNVSNVANEQQQQHQQQKIPVIVNTQQNDQNQTNNPLQRSHQPVQRNPCPAYNSR